MSEKNLLLVLDGIVNLGLGILLISRPAQLMAALALPKVETFFYINILGAVLLGIGIALILESSREIHGVTGLGIGGAIIINICGAVALVLWLLFGGLELSLGGAIFLWSIALVVLGLAFVEFFTKAWKD